MGKSYYYFTILILCAVTVYAQKPKQPDKTQENAYIKPVDDSHICIPLKFPIPRETNFAKELCTYYKGNYSDTDVVLPLPLTYTIDVDYMIWRDEVFDEFDLYSDRLSLSEKIYYWADGLVIVNAIAVSGQCGWDDEAAREIIIGFDARFGFSPNYSLITTTTPRKIIVPNRCEVTILNYDVTDNMLPLLQNIVTQAGQQIDEIIPKLTNFKKPAESLWNHLQQPIRIYDNSWLKINPSRISVGKISVSNTIPKTIHTTIGFTFRPEFYSNSEPIADLIPLPPLKTEDCLPGIRLHPEFPFTFDDLSNKLSNSTLVNSTYQIKRRKITVKDVVSYNNNQDVIIGARVEIRPVKLESSSKFIEGIRYFFSRLFCSKNKTIYFRGTPHINSENDFDVQNIDFDADTKLWIQNKASWVLDTNILQSFSNGSSYEISEKVEDFETLLDSRFLQGLKQFNIEYYQKSLIPEKIFIYQDQIIPRFTIVVDDIQN